MDKRAAGQYLTKLFGNGEGYVAVAYKDKDESWQECTFQYPKERTKLLGWAEVHKDANLFICPSLRKGPNRVKGDMAGSRWLWADVDWDKVPADKREDVKTRIAEVGTLVVASGSGENAHVYVQVEKGLDADEHYRLNSGLRDYLYADAKHADNSLLRLPGSTNWKSEAGSPVKVRAESGTVRPVNYLMEKRAFARVKVTSAVSLANSSWDLVDITGLSRRIKAMGTMDTAQAVTRYGSRHKAVWAITGELHKRGLDTDQIHTLMDQFPPAVEKNAEEHNGYDVHRDVDKRLLWDRANNPALVDDEIDKDAGDVFEEMSTEEVMDALVNEGVEKELLRRAIRRQADITEAERGWVGPPDDVSWSLTDALKDPPEPLPYLIDGLAGKKHNVVITAQYKTGKTAFTIGSIAASLADGHDFLDHFPVHTDGSVVGHWNCEMDPAEMMNDYIRPVGIENTDNLVVANLRGYKVNILTPLGKQWAVDWLRKHRVKVWTLDSFARLARMAGVSEKDNDEVMSLLMALDEIKVEADVDVLFLITHTGRAEMEEGKERARGATAIDDWADARWIMTKVDNVRVLAVEGRGVTLEPTPLMFDEATNRSVKGHGTKADIKTNGAVQVVVGVVKSHDGITQAALLKVLAAEPFKMGRRLAMQYIEDADAGAFIETRREPRPSGGRATVKYYLTGGKPENDRARKATPRDVQLSAAFEPRRRSRG